MFDRQFFGSVLQEHVRAEIAANPGKAPVVELHLMGGATLDLCHVVRLADAWVAVAYFCREDVFDDVDIAFLPYGTITRVTLTMRSKEERRIGFSTAQPPIETPSGSPVQLRPGDETQPET
jgi:hypothetical protein